MRVRALGTHLLLEVSGEADRDTAAALREGLGAALAGRPGSITLELSGLTRCDQAGLDALDDFCAEASSARVPPVVLGLSPRLAWSPSPPHGAPAAPGAPPRSWPER